MEAFPQGAELDRDTRPSGIARPARSRSFSGLPTRWERVEERPRLAPGELHVFRMHQSPGDPGSADAAMRALTEGCLSDAPAVGDISPRFDRERSGPLEVLAVTTAGPVGIALEPLAPEREVDALVVDLSERERDIALRIPPGLRHEAVLQCFARKQALSRASSSVGGTAASRASDFTVSVTPGAPARVHHWSKGDAGEWTLVHLRPGPHLVGAVAVRGDVRRVKLWTWSGSVRRRPRP